jgi:CheY-like chemotaxis protein
MTESGFSVLLVDTDAAVRDRLTRDLVPLACTVLEASDGDGAMRILRENDVRVVVSELYLKTSDDECLIRAVRRMNALEHTRTLAHTRFGAAPDRDWAVRAGADAYLIQPTRPTRLRYVVARLANSRDTSAGSARRPDIIRRDSLDVALAELERGGLRGASSIIFSREWWSGLPRPHQTTYRARARKVHVSLRSDSLLSSHFVEVRGPTRSHHALSSERPESPYRR